MTRTATQIRSVGELKRAMKTAKAVYVWVNCWGDEGEYVQVSKSNLLRGMGIDTPNDGAHGGRPDGTACCARLDGEDVYIN